MTTRAPRRRIGALLATELLFILPIVTIFLMVLIGFVFTINADTRVAAASREGARAAAMGGTVTDVNTAVAVVLGADVYAQATVAINYPLMTGSYPGNNPGDPVQVVVSIPGKAMIPNYLIVLGRDIKKVTITAQTTMIIE